MRRRRRNGIRTGTTTTPLITTTKTWCGLTESACRAAFATSDRARSIRPKDPENPEWKNLNSNPGAQYFWIDRIFFWNPNERHESFIFQLFHTSLPGSLDTSLVSSDNINNPRTMNAVYSIAARLKMAECYPEKLTGGELKNKQFNEYPKTKALSKYFMPPDTVLTAHVLKDGADSVGILGALNRVYINIGLFSEEWLLHFRPLIGNSRQEDHADRDRRAAEELGLLERQRRSRRPT